MTTPRFKVGDFVKEDRSFGIILASGDVSYDVVWVGGSTSRYRYATGRHVRLATQLEIDAEIPVAHLRQEAAAAREERRIGARRKRGQVWPSR